MITKKGLLLEGPQKLPYIAFVFPFFFLIYTEVYFKKTLYPPTHKKHIISEKAIYR